MIEIQEVNEEESRRKFAVRHAMDIDEAFQVRLCVMDDGIEEQKEQAIACLELSD